MKDHSRCNCIRVYHSCLILLLLSAILWIPAVHAASDTTIIGFRWDTSDPSPRLSQIDSTGATIPKKDATFWDNWAVTGNMKTVVITPSNQILYGTNNRGDGLDLSGAYGDVMVEIPRFYTCSTYANGNFSYYISPLPVTGFTVAPMFNQRGTGIAAGTPAAYYYVGRYDANLVGSKLQSATGKEPAVELTIGQARTYAENKGAGWGITNIWTLSGLRQLFYTEMLTLDSQSAWTKSRGIVDTTAVKNSGADSIDTQIYANNATGSGTGADGYTPVSYRGIENLWGNVWQFQDGFNAIQGTTKVISPTGLGTTGQKTTFKDVLEANDVQSVGALVLTDGFQKNLMNTDVARPLFLPSAVGGSDTTYLSDYYWPPRSTNPGAPNILFSGGRWDYAGGAGVGGLSTASDASYSYAYIGARIGARIEFRRSMAPGASADPGNTLVPEASKFSGSTTATAIPTPVPTSPPLSPVPVSPLIIALLAVLFLVGGGSVIYWMKKKPYQPSYDQPLKRKEKTTIPPHPPGSGSSDKWNPASIENLKNRIASIEQRASGLSHFKSTVQSLLSEARIQYNSGAYDAVQMTLNKAEDTITALAPYETRLQQWKKEGYTTTTLESLKTDNLNIINNAFRDFEQDLATLKQHERQVQELKRSCSTLNVDPAISQRIASIESQLLDPHNIPGIGREIEAIEQILRDQQDIEQLFTRLHAKAEKLTQYAPLTPDSLTEARDQITAGRYDEARTTLQRVEDRIDALLECESLLAAWKAKGYTLPELEGLPPSNADEVLPVFQKTKQNINRLEIIAQELESKKSTDPDLFKQPETVNLVLSIEQNLKNPEEIETIEKNYQQLIEAIRQLEDKQKIIEHDLRDQTEKLQREAVTPAIRREIEPIIKSIRQNDITHSREMLQGLAKQQLLRVNATLSQLRTDGAVVSHSSDLIQEQIAAQNYGDAILESEQVIAELTRIQNIYTKAKVLKSKVTEPAALAQFESGNYEEFVRVIEEQQMLIKKVTDLKEKGRKLLVKSEQFGRVPEHVHSKLEVHDILSLESGIKELETFLSTTKPDLTLTLDHTRLVADTWHKVGVQITNNGGAHAFDVNFSFSPEFETKWINSINIDAGESTTIEIGILPKKEGSIPLEITAMYRDANDKKYSEKHKIWISVGEKGKIPDGQPQFIRAYEFYAGYIRVKIAVKNLTPLTIHDVILEPDVDSAILYLERHEPEEYPSENERIKLGTINPGNDRTVSLYLEPIICAKEGTDVHCHVRYKDALGKPGSIDMEPLRIQIVCPIFETKEPVNIGMLKQLIEDLPSQDSKVFSVPRNLDAQTQLTLVQSVIQLHDVRHICTLRRANNFESWYYGKTKVTQKDMVIKIGVVKDMDKVEITAYGDDLNDLTGLLAEIGRRVTEEISKKGNVQKKINIWIKDSVLTRTNLLNNCDMDGRCSRDVTIQDSVVMRSNIG